MNSKTSLLFAVLLVLTTGVRATSFGVALSPVQRNSVALPTVPTEARGIPRPATFREIPGRGLLVRIWVNGAGPFTFAIDTGAGAPPFFTKKRLETPNANQQKTRTSNPGMRRDHTVPAAA